MTKSVQLQLQKVFLVWIDEKIKNTADKHFRLIINCAQIMSLHWQFRISLSVRDGTMLEVLHREFLPIFFLTKKKYVSIVLDIIDSLC